MKNLLKPLIEIPIVDQTLRAISGSQMSPGFKNISQAAVSVGFVGRTAKNWMKK